MDIYNAFYIAQMELNSATTLTIVTISIMTPDAVKNKTAHQY
jgi:hypothetical protein